MKLILRGPLDEYSSQMAFQISKFTSNTTPILITYQPSDVFSSFSYESFLKVYKGAHHDIKVDKDGEIYPEDLSTLSLNHAVVLMLTYPVVSGKILIKLNSTKSINANSILMGSSSWTFDLSALSNYKSLIKQFKEAYLPDIIPIEKYKNAAFSKKYYSLYQEQPLGIHIMAYDATKIAINCSLGNSKIKTLSDVKSCITNTNHSGIVGKYKFKMTNPFSIRKIYFTNLKKKLETI